MSTKIKCRIGSDGDRLSKLQLQEVIDSLAEHCAKARIESAVSQDDDLLLCSKSAPHSPARLAMLMSRLRTGCCDALVVNASYLPPKLTSSIAIGAITSRLTPYDVIISTDEQIFDELPENSTVIANEIRREAQLLYYRPDLNMVRMRGSVDAMIQKVRKGKVDAAILAAADVERLQKQDYVAEVFTNSICVPAAGQGSLAVLVRSEDEQIAKVAGTANDPASYSEIKAEWAFLEALNLSESDPVGVLGSIEGKKIELEGVLALPDGREKIRAVVGGVLGREEELGSTLAAEILEVGGREILQELNLL